MSCPESIPISSTPKTVNTASCLPKEAKASDYGLLTFQITLSSVAIDNIITTEIRFLGDSVYRMTVRYDNNTQTITADRGTLPRGRAAADVYNLAGEIPLTAYAIFFPVNGVTATPIQFLFNYNGIRFGGNEIVVSAREQSLSFSLPT